MGTQRFEVRPSLTSPTEPASKRIQDLEAKVVELTTALKGQEERNRVLLGTIAKTVSGTSAGNTDVGAAVNNVLRAYRASPAEARALLPTVDPDLAKALDALDKLI